MKMMKEPKHPRGKEENKNTHKRETKGIKAHAKKKSEEAYKRVDSALREMALNKEPINFNTVMKKSNVSKGFVYQNEEIDRKSVV